MLFFLFYSILFFLKSIKNKKGDDEKQLAVFQPNKIRKTLFCGSVLINEKQREILEYFILDSLKEEHVQKTWVLRYRSSRDGLNSTKFHDRCDNLDLPTIVLVKSDNGSIFGGFTLKDWDNATHFFGHYTADKKAFIFSLYNAMEPQREALKFPIKNYQKAIWCRFDSLPNFGGYDICLFFFLSFCKCLFSLYLFDKIGLNENIQYENRPCYSKSCLNYGYWANGKDPNTVLCGSNRFQISEIEVFSLT